MGVHPETELGRRYRDVLGRVNQQWAPAADTTLLLVAGRAIPLTILETAVTRLRDLLRDLPASRRAATAAVHERAAEILRPRGALALARRGRRVDRRVASHRRPRVERPVGLIFAADHGVAAAETVSAYPIEVTAAMFDAYRHGRSTINAFARQAGATVTAVDVGIGRPTGDIRFERRSTPERFDEIVDTAVAAVDGLDGDLLVLGEMGIGNTTPRRRWPPRSPAARRRRGSARHGRRRRGLARKRVAVQQAVRRIAGVTDPLEVLREVGGAELVAIAAAVVAARRRSLPVVLDGYVVTASVLPLVMVDPTALDHCIVGHCSAEPGHRRLLERLGKRPLLDLDMRLGEGCGAMAAVPMVAMACAGITEVPTFAEWFGDPG